eukprot:1591855-Prorocentrum_lima.AAC.1
MPEFVHHVGEDVAHHKNEKPNKERPTRITQPNPQKKNGGPQKHQTNDGKLLRDRNVQKALKT